MQIYQSIQIKKSKSKRRSNNSKNVELSRLFSARSNPKQRKESQRTVLETNVNVYFSRECRRGCSIKGKQVVTILIQEDQVPSIVHEENPRVGEIVRTRIPQSLSETKNPFVLRKFARLRQTRAKGLIVFSCQTFIARRFITSMTRICVQTRTRSMPFASIYYRRATCD